MRSIDETVDIKAVQISFYNVVVAIAIALSGLYAAYRRLRPKPIPGIPFNRPSARRLLGDIPDALKWRKETGEMWSFLRKRSMELQSPIFQMFMWQPFGKPWVVITDFRESLDIQSHRQGEFDRSAFLADVFGPLLPGNQVWLPSNNEFLGHRSLLRDTMSPAFLHSVVAPIMHSSIEDLFWLWREKLRLAGNRPFRADTDIVRAIVDLILHASLGIQTRLSQTQAELLSKVDKIDLPQEENAPVSFPVAKESPTYAAVRTLVNSIQIGMASPAPRLHMKFALRFYPSLVSAKRFTDGLMTEVLQTAWRKFFDSDDQDHKVTSAADLLVRREAQMAKKQNRSVMQNSIVIRDELFGFYLAGHETTSTTLCWAVKHLSEHQEIQSRLRSALRSAYRAAATENRLPTAAEIVEINVPYLDAFIEENHRLGTAIPVVIRRATKDSVVLGHQIPKDTDVFMMMNGPGFQSPAFPVDESSRSQSSQVMKDKYGVWDDNDVAMFKPERFLVQDKDGIERFDSYAGPALPYGAGLRGCFGIKLGILELRLILTMIVWAFEMQRTPTDLSSFEAHDVNTRRPKRTYLKLVETTS